MATDSCCRENNCRYSPPRWQHIASVASPKDETLWLDSALSLSVQELDRRIKDGTDRLATTLCVWLTEEERIAWENALEIARRVSGAEISPGQALGYLAAEFHRHLGFSSGRGERAAACGD